MGLTPAPQKGSYYPSSPPEQQKPAGIPIKTPEKPIKTL